MIQHDANGTATIFVNDQLEPCDPLQASLVKVKYPDGRVVIGRAAGIAKWAEDTSRDEAGRWTNGGGESGGGETTTRELQHYRGIGEVTLIPARYQNPDTIRENREILDSVLDRLPPGVADGLRMLKVTDGTMVSTGAAYYVPPTPKPSLWSDTIVTQQKWLDLMPEEKTVLLLHEFAHRMQQVTHVSTFKEFKRQGLASHAKILLGEFYKNYDRKFLAGEAFAESFAWYKTGKRLPESLQEFWSKTKL